MTEAFRSIIFGSTALGLVLAWLAWRITRLDGTSPDRLVMELRLAQLSALLLVLAAGVYVGLAIAHEDTSGAGTRNAVTRKMRGCRSFMWGLRS